MSRPWDKQKQSISSKEGEIRFRSKIYLQHVEGKSIFSDEYNRDEILEVIKSRVKKSDSDFAKLQREVTLSPFLEIGAERCQRSMLLVDKYQGDGFAIDISFHSLKSADYFSNCLNMRLPVRICCDAYNLPFRNKSFPFVFCYETLHHFPDPSPVLKEIKRIMCDKACFFFDEEPVKQGLKLNLYRRKNKIYSKKERKKSLLIKILERFISSPTCTEVEHGIVENEDISVSDWQKALSIFGKGDVTLKLPLVTLACKLDTPTISAKRLLIRLLGGGISGMCFTEKDGNPHPIRSIFDLLGCPNCLEMEGCDISKCKLECQVVCNKNAIVIREDNQATIDYDKCTLCFDCLYACPLGAINKPPLVKRGKNLVCESCGKEYICVDDVFILFSEKEERELYPDLVSSG